MNFSEHIKLALHFFFTSKAISIHNGLSYQCGKKCWSAFRCHVYCLMSTNFLSIWKLEMWKWKYCKSCIPGNEQPCTVTAASDCVMESVLAICKLRNSSASSIEEILKHSTSMSVCLEDKRTSNNVIIKQVLININSKMLQR